MSLSRYRMVRPSLIGGGSFPSLAIFQIVVLEHEKILHRSAHVKSVSVMSTA